jgi:hypothetical protein
MAWTVTVLKKTTFGDQKVQQLLCLADAAESNIATGLNVVDCIATAYKSMTTGASKLAINVNSSGTASVGTVGASGFTSGDVFYMTVFGH